jgi:SOS-response transcriptional repressor LexA
MTDGQRLVCFREAVGLSQIEAARQIGINRSYLFRLERDEVPLANIGSRVLRGMVKVYGKTAGEIQGLPERKPAKKASPQIRALRLPIVGSIPCGQPELTEGVRRMSSDRYLEVASSSVTKASNEDNLFVLEVHGNCLIGDGVSDGDFLIVDKGKPFVDDKIYAACIDGECCARHVRRKGRKLMLWSSTDMLEVEADTVAIQGKVIKVNRMRDLE